MLKMRYFMSQINVLSTSINAFSTSLAIILTTTETTKTTFCQRRQLPSAGLRSPEVYKLLNNERNY